MRETRITRLRSSIALAALAAVVVSTTGCAYALAPPTPPDPRFARERAALLSPGMSVEAIRGMLGTPDRTAARRTRTDWFYESVGSRRACRVSFLGLPLADAATERRTLALRFGAAGLETATLTERLPEHTLRTRLVEATDATRQGARPQADRTDEYVRAEMQRQRIPAASVAVLKDGKIVKIAGYGVADRKTGAAATPDTVYKIGSISKQFIATGIMLLVREGRLRIDDPISKYLDGTPATWSGITIRHLLTHTSGIQREAPAFDPWKVQPDIDVVRSAYPLPLRFPPGSKWEYCNTGYFALAEIITRVSGTPWADYLRLKVFEPAGMRSTAPTNTTRALANRATGYTDNDDPREAADWTALRPSGAFLSTVTDLAKWDALLDTDTPLPEATRREMWTPVALTDGSTSPYGFGWSLDPLNGRKQIHHGGSLPGFISEYTRLVDDRISVIVLINMDDADVRGLARGVAALYLQDVPATAGAR